MNRNKPKDEPNSIEDVQQKAFNSMIESLNRYGPTEVHITTQCVVIYCLDSP
jgi:hypothetical protein